MLAPMVDVGVVGTDGTGAWGYRSYRELLAERLPGLRVRKLCLDAGFTCPNLDGTVARGGCSYCDNRGFSPAVVQRATITEQWARGRRALRRRHRRVDGFIAYFQAFSNTHASTDRLRAIYDPLPESLPECLGVSLGTRPDCLADPVLDLLADLGRRTFLTVEIGLQSDRDAVLRQLNRGHSFACFLDAVHRAAEHRLELCVHLMLGLPGEGPDAPERMGDLMASLPVASVKIHNLHVMRGTAWEALQSTGHLTTPTQGEHLDRVARLIARLRPDQAVQRLIADAPDHLLVGDRWCHDKQGFLRDLAPRLRGGVAAA